MAIARVIVDVPAQQTDRPFDYKIPEKWEGLVQPGIRVNVPFGPRQVQGFVVEITDKSDFKKLKSITSLLDVTPVLTKELLSLGFWLTDTTLSFAISTFQAMLPAALRAKYEKQISLINEQHLDHLHPSVQPLFKSSALIDWGDVEDSDVVKQIRDDIQKGFLEVIYTVKDKARPKYIRCVEILASLEEIAVYIDKLPDSRQSHKLILEFLQSSKEPIAVKDIEANLKISPSAIKTLVKKGLLIEKQVEHYRNPFENQQFEKTVPLALTNEQRKVLDTILLDVNKNQHNVFLLYGVTGSGKTEVYLQTIDSALRNGKEAIVLVPEISLTPQMVKRFKGRFGSQVAVLHSGLSVGEKYDEWRKIQRKEVKVVVGARSAIFAPFENIGVIIIDEEHETSYKQEDHPRYHARDVAIHRASVHQCPVILGSATPMLESFARAQKGVYTLLSLTKRVHEQAMPAVNVVDMRDELRSGNRSMFSTLLYEKLKDRLEKQQQTVLLLNKRGYSSFIMCRDCGLVINCPYCDISLTYHKRDKALKCHYCGYSENEPAICPQCGSNHIRYFGTGTQKVEEELGKVLPEARVIRMDVDTTSRKGAHEKLLSQFANGKADVLLGTQMIAKGLDFPNVTLVGVLSADTTLHIPDFRSSEKTFQLLTQVSGRAGRDKLPGEVVIQSYTPEHYSIQLASEHNYDEFYQQEMQIRKLHQYPPFYYVALIIVTSPELMKAVDVTEKITTFMRSQLTDEAIVLGPVACMVPRINNRYRYQCMIKYKKQPNLYTSLKRIIDHYQATSSNELTIAVDVNPFMLL
ncbi:primosomal protein N' [Bacillus sp. HMF5848]|uniref:primosomal protein N' n=1 Tax=Bacillus sp. HMF5848 TaxID=2495421 RepID=UPI000F7AE708|nr:primosomal protein N' [Bacillus sp. HMF5848]RSK26976.1 primosomal protein N' [Bacillus sp. HMF5848]